MLRISRLADYGIIAMAAIDNHKGIVSWDRLCDITQLPHPTTKKILRMLVKQNLVAAERGLKGGYRLSRDSDEISLADIVEAIDGKIAITECSHDEKGSCEYSGMCDVKSNWNFLNQHIYQLLNSISLQEMHTKNLLDNQYLNTKRIISKC